VALPEGKKAQVAPSVTALPKKVMAAAMLARMVFGTMVRSGGEGGGGEDGGGDDGVEGGGGEGGGDGGGGKGEGIDAGQSETQSLQEKTPVRVVAQVQTVPLAT
jgi:hypothetical protein